ncbi:cortexin-3 isoform X5 [Eleutherodactylus coqui]|uniref:cortexin-3 isoform X5 n=1 Tax=Eleutherodactylus coqui TaxID=57060 RepID=UPI003462D5F0
MTTLRTIYMKTSCSSAVRNAESPETVTAVQEDQKMCQEKHSHEMPQLNISRRKSGVDLLLQIHCGRGFYPGNIRRKGEQKRI